MTRAPPLCTPEVYLPDEGRWLRPETPSASQEAKKEEDFTMEKHTFELRQVDAYQDETGCWTYNTSYLLATYRVRDGADEQRAFKRALRKLGITFVPRTTTLIFDGDFYEIADAKTDEPLFVAIPA